MRLKIQVLAAVMFVLAISVWGSIRPSGDRRWADDQARSVSVSFNDSSVTIENARHFDHCPENGGKAVQRWGIDRYNLSDLHSVWLIISLFDRDRRGPAHPFLSFQFGDTSFVAVSVEARRESHESYSIWKGMIKRFELVYIITDERDIVKLRAICRDDAVYIYPISASPEKVRKLFVDILERAVQLGKDPEFYNTIWNNCTTNVLDHANAVASEKIPGGLYLILPGYCDKVALSQGLIDEEGPLDEVRKRFMVNDRVRKYADNPEFSVMIRQTGSDPDQPAP
ncbi:MAG: DUF4105 domain-containing protein [Candidatus Krumholzibacteriota bacterium]|nr:DUF4105 domain-containing protein [Candidatus Krumholzibacteriota bacterium]